jgi:peptidoglycan DL-endopeptidase CwlO
MARIFRICLLALTLAVCAACLPRAASAPRLGPGSPVVLDRGGVKRLPPERHRAGVPGAKAVAFARRWLGVPYRWGGATPAGFDCSGFTSYVWRRFGVRLPHNAAAQFSAGTPVPRSRLRPGDLLFFSGLGHVGMYVGRGRMIHSPHSGSSVEIVQLADRYGDRLVGARRVGRAVAGLDQRPQAAASSRQRVVSTRS